VLGGATLRAAVQVLGARPVRQPGSSVMAEGVHVPPAELEAVLLGHPDVTDAAVVGLPAGEAGEISAGLCHATWSTRLGGFQPGALPGRQRLSALPGEPDAASVRPSAPGNSLR